MNDRRDDRILPDPPEGLTWPPQFHNSELWRKRAGLRIYLETYWLPFIERSLVDMRLRAYYPTTVTEFTATKQPAVMKAALAVVSPNICAFCTRVRIYDWHCGKKNFPKTLIGGEHDHSAAGGVARFRCRHPH